ncbi:hypothetical protein KPL70_007188 [Citrus sinensis]|nr:hypothetical protein KPL70_007188 [Citrus sinensis]
MSLFEESNGEEYNDEQVNRGIQSLEGEINGQYMLLESRDLPVELELLSNIEEDGQNCLESMDFGWADEVEQVPCSPSDDMNWSNYMDECGGLDLDDLVEYEIVSSRYSQIYNIVSEYDHLEHGFSFL